MKAVTVVLDTNTLVSAIGWAGPPRRVLLALREGRHRFVTSIPLLEELVRVLQYPKLACLRDHPALPAVLAWLYSPDHLVAPTQAIDVIKEDPADNRCLEAAVAGQAEIIVSGDRHLLDLGTFRGIKILAAKDFCDIYLP